jgi:hypothetical protein
MYVFALQLSDITNSGNLVYKCSCFTLILGPKAYFEGTFVIGLV